MNALEKLDEMYRTTKDKDALTKLAGEFEQFGERLFHDQDEIAQKEYAELGQSYLDRYKSLGDEYFVPPSLLLTVTLAFRDQAEKQDLTEMMCELSKIMYALGREDGIIAERTKDMAWER